MRKRYLAVGLAGLMLILTAGCGAKSTGSYDMAVNEEAPAEAPMAAGAEVYEEEATEEAWDSGELTSENGIESVTETSRKLIKTVNLEMQTREFDTLTENLTGKVQELGGYVESSSIRGSSYYYADTRSADYTVRIPSDRLDEFVAAAGEMGNITYKNEYVDDVTLEYVDVESRKKALETEQERLLTLLEQADNLEDLLTIESRLSQVRYELESYGSRLRILDNQVDYSTVNISIMEVERITETRERTFFEEIGDRFSDSLYIVGRGLRGFVIGFIGSLPILAVWAVVIAVIVLLLRKIFSGRKEKKEKRRSFLKKKSDKEEQEES